MSPVAKRGLMLGYGICIGTEAKYEAFARPGLAKQAPAAVFERREQASIFEAYNSILDEALGQPQLDGLCLLHEDTELREPIDAILANQFADPSVAIVGVIGGKGVRSVRWFRSEERYGRAPDPVNGENNHGAGEFDVDIVDGLFLALSPWAMRNLRFDSENYSGFHAYDADICMQARAAGRRVRVVPIDLMHHTKGGFGDVATHRRNDDAFRRKWGIPRDPLLQRLRRQLRNHPY